MPGVEGNNKVLCYDVIALTLKDNKYVLIDSLWNLLNPLVSRFTILFSSSVNFYSKSKAYFIKKI